MNPKVLKDRQKDPDGAVLKTEFLSLGGGFFWKFAEAQPTSVQGRMDGSMPGEYHQFIIAYDNAGNISTSEKMVQTVINPLAPVVELAPADLAKAYAIIESNGSISSIVIDYNGTGYNAVPEVLIVGDGKVPKPLPPLITRRGN